MTDHIEVLHTMLESARAEQRQYLPAAPRFQYWLDRIDALESAIDQLRWRDVREELPTDEGIYLVEGDNWVGTSWWVPCDNRWWEVDFEVERWRPITLPESTQTTEEQ